MREQLPNDGSNKNEQPASPETGMRFLEAAKKLVGARPHYECELSGGRSVSIELSPAKNIEKGEPAVSLLYVAKNEKETYTTVDYRVYADGRAERILAMVPERAEIIPNATTPREFMEKLSHQQEVVEADEQLQREYGGATVTESELLALAEELEQLG